MTDPIEHRVMRLEDGVDRLADTLANHSQKVDHKLDGIASLLTSLVRVEERQATTNARLLEGAETMRDHEVRIEKIEIQMPSLLEKSKWVVLGVLAVIGFIGTELLNRTFH